MTAKDQLKVIRNGFTIIRKDEVNLRLKFKNTLAPEWRNTEIKYSSKRALKDHVKELLEDSYFIED
jgi:hypothetical protein